MGIPLRVLILGDSEDDGLSVLREIRRGGYEPTFQCVDTACAMNAALDRETWDIVLAEYAMPNLSALGALKILKERGQDLPFIVVSGKIGESAVVEILKAGAHDCVLKDDLGRLLPAIERELREAVVRQVRSQADEALRKAHVELKTLLEEQTAALVRANQALQVEIVERIRSEHALQRSIDRLQAVLNGTVDALAAVVEFRDPYAAGHQQRVTELARAIAERMDLSQHNLEGVRVASTIHDVGKICIPAEILNKPGRISVLELDLVRTHPTVGYEILQGIEFPWPVAQIVLQHHERVDGSGYPQHLVGRDILLESRILAVADVVEALSSYRPYRKAFDTDQVLREISMNRGILYDPDVVDVCLRLFRQEGFEFDQVAPISCPPRSHGQGMHRRPGGG